jgi:formylglycine-generating enzyme required for sulfatase activity
MQEEVSRQRTFRFADAFDQDLHGGLAAIDGDLASFQDEISIVEARLTWARRLSKWMDAHAARWKEARRALRSADGGAAIALYARHPIDLDPQPGLAPIGKNPVTGLWEFYDLRSAADPDTIPSHGEDGSIAVDGDTGVVFVLIPGGAFTLGAQSEDRTGTNYDPNAQQNEWLSRVEIEPFFLARHELTQGQWMRLAGGRNPSFYTAQTTNGHVTLAHPVEHVSYEDCKRLLAEHGLVLPKESHWEYAARAGTTTPYWSGEDRESLRGVANLGDRSAQRMGVTWPGIDPDFEDGFPAHAPVDALRANPWGLHHIHGNVDEWCEAFYDDLRARGEITHVYRGGNYQSNAFEARISMRAVGAGLVQNPALGARAARNLVPR